MARVLLLQINFTFYYTPPNQIATSRNAYSYAYKSRLEDAFVKVLLSFGFKRFSGFI